MTTECNDVQSQTVALEAVDSTSLQHADADVKAEGARKEEDDAASLVSALSDEALSLVLEAALFSQPEPMSLARMKALFVKAQCPETSVLQAALDRLQAHYQGRAVVLEKTASGYRFQTKVDYAPYLKRLQEKKPPKASRAYMETLAIIAYRQPITRGEIEQIRGIAVNSQIIKNMLDRAWIKVAGYRDVPGRPALLCTTKTFLDAFQLTSLSALPPLDGLKESAQAQAELPWDAPLAAVGAEAEGAEAALESGLLKPRVAHLEDVDALLEEADAVTARVAAMQRDPEAKEADESETALEASEKEGTQP